MNQKYKNTKFKVFLKRIIGYAVLFPFFLMSLLELTSIGLDRDTLSADFWVWILIISIPVLLLLELKSVINKFHRLEESFPEVEERLEECEDIIADTHFFLSDCIVSFSPIDVLYYNDVKKLHFIKRSIRQSHGGYRNFSTILAVKKDGKKVTFTHFSKEYFFSDSKYNEEYEKNYNLAEKMISEYCKYAKKSDMSPELEKRIEKIKIH